MLQKQYLQQFEDLLANLQNNLIEEWDLVVKLVWRRCLGQSIQFTR